MSIGLSPVNHLLAYAALILLPRDAMHKRGLCGRVVYVRPSVRHVRVFCRNE